MASRPSADTLCKATERAAAVLGLSTLQVSRMLQISRSSWYRLRRQQAILVPGTTAWQRAVDVVNLYVYLRSLLGSDEMARGWLRQNVKSMRARPIDLLATPEGVDRVMAYLVAAMGR